MPGQCCATKVLLKELNQKITVQNFRPVLLNLSLLLPPCHIDENKRFMVPMTIMENRRTEPLISQQRLPCFREMVQFMAVSFTLRSKGWF